MAGSTGGRRFIRPFCAHPWRRFAVASFAASVRAEREAGQSARVRRSHELFCVAVFERRGHNSLSAFFREVVSSDGELMNLLPFVDEYVGRGRTMNRRQWLTIGTLGGAAIAAQAAGTNAAAEAARRPLGFGRAKSVIIVFASGGQSQIDMWDPKPLAPLDVRGAFRPLPTSVPGIQFCEHMPRIARVADRLTVVRNMSHEDLDHGTAAYLALTGRYHTLRSANPLPSPNDFPTIGAVLRRVRNEERFLADAVHLNGPALVPIEPAPGQNGGFLGRGYEPMLVGDVRQASVATRGLVPRPDVPPVRMSQRLTLKQNLEQHARSLERQAARDMDHLYREALELLSSPAAREAFAIESEPPRVRERYGLHRSGQACLLARRLVEAGVPFVNVIWNHTNRGQDLAPDDTDEYGWDTHNDIFDALEHRLLPRFDVSFSALIEDLDERGLLDETLVVCMGEFGRAPQVALEPRFAGSSPGRKHWASVYSIVLAGAGVGRGHVVGASDRLGAEPVGERYGPWDLVATIFSALGIDPQQHFTDTLGRPFAISEGRPIEAAYAG